MQAVCCTGCATLDIIGVYLQNFHKLRLFPRFHEQGVGLADRAAIFIAPRIVGSVEAPSFAAGTGVESIERAWRLVRTQVQPLDPDWLITGDFERIP